MNDPELRIHIHNELCRVADLVLFRYNPCLRTDKGCIAGEECCEHWGYVHDPGTGACAMLSEDGCTMPNLGCKLYLCDKARERTDPIVLETFRLMDELARLWGITSTGLRDG